MALAPAFNQLFANPKGPNAGEVPKRFIFIRKSSGLRPLEVAPVDFDAKQKKLVWEAVGVGRITDKARENLRQTVMEGVPVFFSKYPYVAGSGTPVSSEN